LVSVVHAQDDCKTAVAEAQKHYDAGRFLKVIEKLARCLPDGIPKKERTLAYRLQALAYLAEDYRDEAKIAIGKILDHNPDYDPDSIQNPEPFRKLVEAVKSERPLLIKVVSGRKKWYWIGGGGIVAAGVFGFLIRKDKPEEKDLPTPPELP